MGQFFRKIEREDSIESLRNELKERLRNNINNEILATDLYRYLRNDYIIEICKRTARATLQGNPNTIPFEIFFEAFSQCVLYAFCALYGKDDYLRSTIFKNNVSELLSYLLERTLKYCRGKCTDDETFINESYGKIFQTSHDEISNGQWISFLAHALETPIIDNASINRNTSETDEIIRKRVETYFHLKR